jgi:DNA-directed RNA polymerase subunit RPC12/RpoP
MKITKYYCNRCGKEVRTYKLFELSLLLYGIFNPEPFYSDICKDCSKSFKNWFNLKSQKQDSLHKEKK